MDDVLLQLRQRLVKAVLDETAWPLKQIGRGDDYVDIRLRENVDAGGGILVRITVKTFRNEDQIPTHRLAPSRWRDDG